MADKHFGKTKDRHIYLSTSNQASPDDVRQIRRWLLERGWTIIEHVGGVYNEKLLYETSMMLMVGYDTLDVGSREVGRGQYNHLLQRESYDYGSNWMLCGYTDITGEPIFRPVTTRKVMNSNNYKRDYGLLRVKAEGMLQLQDYNKVGVDERKRRKVKEKTGVGFNQADHDARWGITGHYKDIGENSSYEYGFINLGEDRKISLGAVNIVRNFKT